MPSNLQKPRLQAVQPTHVDIFVEHYDQLRRSAMQLSEYDVDRAEDLLHDAFVHFTSSKPDLSVIENLDGYMYVMMRNLHLSQVRRATRSALRHLSAVDYDTLNVGLWASDPRDRHRLQDELGAVCQYACIRKETSKAGSVLILRFFHGYYPDEIASLLGISRPAVKERLRLARAEAKLYLEDPARLAFLGDVSKTKAPNFKPDQSGDGVRLAVRSAIFASCRGGHASTAILAGFYGTEAETGPDSALLAHMVSCEKCIDTANTLLDIPLLASRYPTDTIGKRPDDKGGSGGGGAGGGRKMLDSYIRRSNELYYHEPQELFISANGHLQGFQRVASQQNEMTLIIDITETLGFIEVFSEQGVRLLMLNVEPPPSGDSKQSSSVELSDGRSLDVRLNFSGAFPALQVTYVDPSINAQATSETEPDLIASLLGDDAGPDRPTQDEGFRLRSLFGGAGAWLRPARLTAAFAAVLIVVLLFVRFGPTGTVSAAELLDRAAQAEAAALLNADRVLHRTLELEEKVPGGEVVSRKRIDVWQSGERGVTARRLYDEQGRLAMGDWRRSDGVQTIYSPGQEARLQPLPEKRIKNLAFDDAWQLSMSAAEFMALLDTPDQAAVESTGNGYVVSYSQRNDGGGLIRARLVLGHDDLRPIEQTFTLRYGETSRDYRLSETAYESRPTNSVAPAVFDPNVELTNALANLMVGPRQLGTVSIEAEPDTIANALANTNTNSAPPPAAVATAALEVEVIDLLNGANAFMGEQMDVTRTASGQIHVSALVETAQRKAELMSALAPVRGNPAVRINIETVAEAQARQKRRGAGTPGQVTIDQYQATENTSLVYSDLRKKFSDAEATAFSDRVLRRSAQARRHALAAKQLSDRFSISDLASLSPAERERWLGLIRGHAISFLAEIESTRNELRVVFPDLGGVQGARSLGSDKEIQTAVRELFDLGVACDEDLRRSLAVLTNARGAAEVKTAKFWQQINTAAALARAIQSAR